MRPEAEANTSHDDGYRFMNALADAIQLYGLSTADTWDGVTRVARALGWNVRFVSTPNYVQSYLWQDDVDSQQVHFIANRSGNYDLSKMARLRDLMDQVEEGSVLPAQGLERLHEIHRATAPYGPVTNAVAYILCGSSFAVILGTSWMDVLFGGLLGLVSYGIAVWAKRAAGVATLMELLAAMICAGLATIIANLLPGSNPTAVTVCAVIWFVPGFGLTIAPNELIMGHTLSGMVWFTNALTTMFKLLGGGVLGFALVQNHWHVDLPEPVRGIAPAWCWVFVPLLVGALAVLFQVRKRDLIWGLLGAWAVWGGMQVGNAFGSWQGTFLGMVALIVFANLCHRMLSIPVAAITLPGVMVLVPGVATLRTLYVAQTQGYAAGFQSGFQVIVLIAAILGGLLVGNAILSSIQASRSRLRRIADWR